MSKNNNYKPGNPEYDFWNDKNLYPSLKNDADYPTPSTSTPPAEDHKTGFGTVLLITFLWLLIFAPFALFFTWEDGIVQVVFWGGTAIVLITCAIAFYNTFQDYKRQQK